MGKRTKKTKAVPVVKVLGLDPGKENFGWSMIESRRLPKKPRQMRVMRAGKVECCVTDYDGWCEQITAFRAEIEGMIDYFQPDLIVFERFILRRIIPKGLTVEVVGAMIGLLGLIAAERSIPIVPLSAVIWKNEFKRQGHDLDWIYKDVDVEAHLVDASFIGSYGCSLWFGDQDELYFEHDVYAMATAVEEAAESGIKENKRKKKRG